MILAHASEDYSTRPQETLKTGWVRVQRLSRFLRLLDFSPADLQLIGTIFPAARDRGLEVSGMSKDT